MSSTSTDKVVRADNGLSDELANALRVLAMDAVQQANSGHPGAPMGMAEMAVALWHGHLRHNPANPHWADRDRFVLSNGHASMLLYALLHLTGYALPLDDLKRFRQLHSKTPGHPEHGLTPGVETTTGPLGQGLANAVGFALAEKLLADEFNRPEGIMQFYARKVLERHSLWLQISGGKECVSCQTTPNNWFTAVHHRETPERLKEGLSDAGIVWKTETLEALRDGAAIEGIPLPPQDSLRDEVSYAIGALKGSPRSEVAARYLAFLATPQGQAAYASFGFVSATPQELVVKPIP